MTAREIADRFLGNEADHFGGEPTPVRIRKLIALCGRMKVPIVDVLAFLPSDVTEKMKG